MSDRASRLLLAALLALSLLGCLDDWEVDGETYPCRGPEDCVEDWACHPERWVCVPAGSLADAGTG